MTNVCDRIHGSTLLQISSTNGLSASNCYFMHLLNLAEWGPHGAKSAGPVPERERVNCMSSHKVHVCDPS